MKKITYASLSLLILLVLSSCNLGGASPNTITGEASPLRLTVQTRNGANTFSAAGETINYDYIITNTGDSRLAGPAIVIDEGRQVSCPDVTTVGNLDNYLDLNETINCTSTYTVTDSNVSTGAVINLAKANVGGIDSNQSGVTLTRGVAQVAGTLVLTKTASSQTYGQAGQIITYNYTITNTGTTPLGPTQFIITDNKFSGPQNCGPAETTLQPNQPVTCSFPYTITDADMGVATLTNSATASGAGQTSAPASASVTNLTVAAATQTANTNQATVFPSSNLASGSTIQHQVAVGEWLIQIGRCYGANFEALRNANPQIADPDFILPSMLVTVPNIGSTGRIYGPPCVTFHTVQSGDTWASIAQQYNADLIVLQKVNPGAGLTAGTKIKVPLNSAGAVGVTAVPVTATATATATTAAAAQRITFAPGQTTASVAGVVGPNQPAQYVLATTAGQTLNISVSTSATNEVGLGVNGPTGLALKPMDGNLTWSTAITTGGDHLINIASILGSSNKTYTLTVSLTSPTVGTPTFTATATNTPTTPNP